MTKLLLFSGGVESTAALTTLNPAKDVALVVTHCMNGKPFPSPNNDWELVKKIAYHYKFYHLIKYDLNYNYMIGIDGGGGYGWHQRYGIIGALFTLLPRMPEVTEVMSGFHAEETQGSEWFNVTEKLKIFFPHISFTIPHENMTKGELWNIIDDEVKPYIRTCYATPENSPTHNPDTCVECQEYVKYCT